MARSFKSGLIRRIKLPVNQLEDRTTPASFQRIGVPAAFDYLYPSAVSNDGTVVAINGYGSTQSDQAYRWTRATGMVGLGFSPSTISSYANGMSPDGAVIVGQCRTATNLQQAFRWTAATGMVGLGITPGGMNSWALSVAADGTSVYGVADSPTGNYVFEWKAVTGMSAYYPFFGYVIAISNDGTTAVGGLGSSAFEWTADGGTIDLGSGLGSSSANAISGNGSVVVGSESYGFNELGSFRWTATMKTKKPKRLVIKMPKPPVIDLSKPPSYEAVAALFEQWKKDDNGYDKAVWPEIKAALEENRKGQRKLFRD